MTTAATPTPASETPAPVDPKIVATGQLFSALAADPKYRSKVLRLIKEAAPETPMPELDLETNLLKTLDDKLKPGDDAFKKLQERLDSIDNKLVRDDWRNKNGLSDEELVEVEELAKKEKLPSGAVALELWQHRNNAGTPRSTRKPADGSTEYLAKLQKISPRNQRALKEVAVEEANRIFAQRAKGR